MADWRLVAKRLALANGRIIDSNRARIIEEELLADGKIDKSAFEFLIALRRAARSVDATFDGAVFKAIKPVILKDGFVSPGETRWLHGLFMSNGKLDERERLFLKDLKESSRSHCPEFLAWCKGLGLGGRPGRRRTFYLLTLLLALAFGAGAAVGIIIGQNVFPGAKPPPDVKPQEVVKWRNLEPWPTEEELKEFLHGQTGPEHFAPELPRPILSEDHFSKWAKGDRKIADQLAQDYSKLIAGNHKVEKTRIASVRLLSCQAMALGKGNLWKTTFEFTYDVSRFSNASIEAFVHYSVVENKRIFQDFKAVKAEFFHNADAVRAELHEW